MKTKLHIEAAADFFVNGVFSEARKEIKAAAGLANSEGVEISELVEEIAEDMGDPMEFERFVSRTLLRLACPAAI